jgi:hypothetical protein
MQYGEGNTVYQELLGVFDEVRNMGRKLADLEADMSDPTVSTDPVLFADVDLHLSYGERVGVERELAAAYRDSDYKLGEPPRPVPAPR